jgi:1-acyl-sn-glycerol-3-phosphate acyltransferase
VTQTVVSETPRRPERELGPLGLVVFNLLYWPYLLTTIAVLFPVVVLLRLVTFWDRRPTHALTSAWAAHYLTAVPFAGADVEGRERVPDRACIFICNHQSMVDVLAAYATRLPYLFVSKRENFWVPFLGWTMWVNGYVSLKRGHLPSIFKMLRNCQHHLGQGRNLLVFPEGTRSPDGQLIPFFRGAFWMSCRYKVPIVPIIIDGTGQILPKHRFSITPRRVAIRVLDPIEPIEADFDSRRLRDLTHERMAGALASLRAERSADGPRSVVRRRAA